MVDNAPEVIDISDGEASLAEEELTEYREMLDEMGSFPDKVTINTLSMIAEDHAGSQRGAKALYTCIQERLLASGGGERKLPVVYVVDSILKNCKGAYIPIIEEDAKRWMPMVYQSIPDETRRGKLKRVWNTWKDFSIFKEESWKEMGRCFPVTNETSNEGSKGPPSDIGGIARTKDGRLLLSVVLRKEMQQILDELQSTLDNELEKVSLERLAEIEPDLLAKIKKAADERYQETNGGVGRGLGDALQQQRQEQGDRLPSFIIESRSEEALHRAKAWEKLDMKHEHSSRELIQRIQTSVQQASSAESLYTQTDALDMMEVLAVVAALPTFISFGLERWQAQEENFKNKKKDLDGYSNSGKLLGAVNSSKPSYLGIVDKNSFSNEGLKKKIPAVIGILYEVGLPFVSSSDGRRFRTQMELSNHLDALFRRSQIEKVMARTEERGWYKSDPVWTGELGEEEYEKRFGKGGDNSNFGGVGQSGGAPSSEEDADPASFTVPADENRDSCAICGIKFKMVFDNDEGIYHYSNCREIEVLNDDAAEQESEMVLVHVTCWRGLGSPELLTFDQTLQETRRF